MTTKSTRKVVRVSHFTFAAVVRALLRTPCTAEQLAEASGLHRDTVYELMRAMRKGAPPSRAAHISAWSVDSIGRRTVAVFALGPGVDAKRGGHLGAGSAAKADAL